MEIFDTGRSFSYAVISETLRLTTMMAEEVWGKLLASIGRQMTLGRSGSIPVYDEQTNTWCILRNTQRIYEGAENCADPAKVDNLRKNAANLLGRYPQTVEQLEKLGVEVKSLLSHEIETYDDVVAWAESVFNVGPSSKLPPHVADTLDLAFDDFVIQVKSDVFVLPVAPRGSGQATTCDFTTPGSRKKYGPRHEYSRAAFAHQTPPKQARYRGKTAAGEPQRPRGRPRKDGLPPGSPEALQANLEARLAREEARKTREAKKARKLKRPLVRIGK